MIWVMFMVSTRVVVRFRVSVMVMVICDVRL